MRNASKLRAALASLLLGLAAAACGAAAAPAAPAAAGAVAPLVLSPCELEHPLELTLVPAECGTLLVAENPENPAGRRIALYVVRVPAISRRKRADPLIVLAGGPGQAATAFYTTVAGAFARIHRDRDILLIDQRGTGRSNALGCAQEESPTWQAADAAKIAADTRDCLAALSSRADVRYYTTSVAVADLERVRAALGYPRVNLYGTSYGTRVAQHYLRRFPGRVRSLILDGVVPATIAIGPETALDAERALTAILARCAGEPACHDAFGDPARAYQEVRAALARHAVPVRVADPATGAPRAFSFTPEHLATVLRLAGYTSEYAALLPLLLHSADADQDYAPLAAQFLLIERAYSAAVATGMHNSVVCAEDVPFYRPAAIDREHLAATFLGTTPLDGLIAVCRIWPHGPVDEDFHEPLASGVPALLLSGSDDPVTPPPYAEVLHRELPHSRHLVLEGFGHGQLTAPCVDRLMNEFLERASAEALEASCIESARPQAFFTSLNGGPP